ncbi:methyltransferase domain-containing protein [Danxiaibacter flavus]|uniref:Methyltransferase domain-containing protein n=1 Tax=Danxiaibacter flavus TaxID=3049108 RepID=A0ABV3ZD55_9BACT|nr:methyltransferase domain-containing protein [Chitinophagaceae bacterium DXS]
MNVVLQNNNEQLAASAFSKQAEVFDELYINNTIVQYKRDRVRSVVEQYVQPGQKMLELNCGTGEDAIYFAKKGYFVHATDIAEGMLNKLSVKIRQHNLADKISTEQRSFTSLNQLASQEKYDAIFSNFGGLNCTGELDKVLSSFDELLKPRGIACLVILPKFCLWETLLVLKGKFKTATRRFFKSNGAKARVEDTYFTCWYYNANFVKRVLKNKFSVVAQEGLCTLVPPSYVEHFAENHSGSFAFLKNAENKLKRCWPWNCIGDYYIIVLKKNG